MIRAVVLDLGGVLASGEGVTAEPAALLGVPEEEFSRLYWEGRTDYDLGLPDSAYWGPLLEALGKPAAVETVQQLAKLDADLWLRLLPEPRQLLADLRAAGMTTAVLSNAPFNLDMGLIETDFADEADYWFVSAAMGVAKPEKAAFHRVTEVLELAPGEIADRYVGTGDGLLELLEVQPEGKGQQPAAAWRNGARPTPDDRLGA